eukprot:m.113948 g.113948  ORF g.113948 m.113948 type:complete len:377 (-) comp9433_c0_seq7:97-1227(-)
MTHIDGSPTTCIIGDGVVHVWWSRDHLKGHLPNAVLVIHAAWAHFWDPAAGKRVVGLAVSVGSHARHVLLHGHHEGRVIVGPLWHGRGATVVPRATLHGIAASVAAAGRAKVELAPHKHHLLLHNEKKHRVRAKIVQSKMKGRAQGMVDQLLRAREHRRQTHVWQLLIAGQRDTTPAANAAARSKMDIRLGEGGWGQRGSGRDLCDAVLGLFFRFERYKAIAFGDVAFAIADDVCITQRAKLLRKEFTKLLQGARAWHVANKDAATHEHLLCERLGYWSILDSRCSRSRRDLRVVKRGRGSNAGGGRSSHGAPAREEWYLCACAEVSQSFPPPPACDTSFPRRQRVRSACAVCRRKDGSNTANISGHLPLRTVLCC